MSSRKNFLDKTIKMMVGAAASIIDNKIPDNLKTLELPLFPPGAVKEYETLCTGCGECVKVCPAEAIKLTNIGGDKEIAVIEPMLKACIMCDDMPCATICEPAALIKPDSGFPKMGKAEINEDYCLAYNDIHCTFCFDVCPIKRTAIKLKAMKPVIYEEYCTGCGLCKENCVAPGKKGIFITRN